MAWGKEYCPEEGTILVWASGLMKALLAQTSITLVRVKLFGNGESGRRRKIERAENKVGGADFMGNSFVGPALPLAR